MRDVEGALVAGRYELREQIGAGGSGAVFRAYDRVLDRDVAVKRMRPGADDDARARLRIEARLAALLAHPGIARVHDFGEDETGGEAAPFLVMEYVDGMPLRRVLEEQGPMSPDRVMEIVAQLADALAVAHGAGIVHRDVKPSNILVRSDGAVTLIDFGIARGHDAEPVTLTGTIVGTVDYISPEQAGGAGATPLSDLYALGLVAYECLTGIRPLRRDTQVATVMAHLNEDVPTLPRTVPDPVRDLVRRLTARDPRRRPADAATTAVLARAAVGSTVAFAALPAPRRAVRRRWLGVATAAAAMAFVVWMIASQGAGRPTAAAQADAVPQVGLSSSSSTSASVSAHAARPTQAAPTRAAARRVAPRPHATHHRPVKAKPHAAARHGKHGKHGKPRKH
ncbi:hypothetical protein GCM10009798_19850 [Nocardioides panacihumi]|uniref:non-specific serine/threonine protein kinase n=1 Tax=Nocardioides panacihumi TaxID=400774 RepID=A0ABN2QY77_9ACTN